MLITHTEREIVPVLPRFRVVAVSMECLQIGITCVTAVTVAVIDLDSVIMLEEQPTIATTPILFGTHFACLGGLPPQSRGRLVGELWSRSPRLDTAVESLQLGNVGFQFCLGRPAGEGMAEQLISAPCRLPPGPQRDEQTRDDRHVDLDGDPVGVMA